MKNAFLFALTRTIESAPAASRRALLTSLDDYRLARPPASDITEIEWLEAIVEGLGEEVACACYFKPNQE